MLIPRSSEVPWTTGSRDAQTPRVLTTSGASPFRGVELTASAEGLRGQERSDHCEAARAATLAAEAEDPVILSRRPPDTRLADRERELVALKYGAGLTNRDIARLTGLSETNVSTILSRVTHHLRAQWKDEP